ncbi:MAG: UDP-N-acetylglucosamine 2-epimerase (hydrolyzing) [Muribaculaceae bacterium]|nr:UDP-N-acetylglucosamine 2-epimerase (hydrolyzing) [Muribaculaceae bacterium]
MKITVATGTRADWGLLSPLAQALHKLPGFDISILATNMHLLQQFGNTLSEIEADGFDVAARVPMPGGDSPADRAVAMGVCLEGSARELARLQPDLLIILGDRYEMLAIASAATVLGIPIAHLHGGELTYGAIDDNIRHAISKLSALHFTSTAEARRRLIAMGEQPQRVIYPGAIGVWNFCNFQPMTKAELEASLGISLDRPTLLATFHPATLDPADPAMRCRAMLEALDSFADRQLIITYPNNDPRSQGIISEIEAYAAANPLRVLTVRSLGLRRYQSVLPYLEAVVGNSSSGILEVPSAGIPTVNIGSRQEGRDRAPSVIDCGDSADDIRRAIARAISPEFRAVAAGAENPYYKPDTLELMVEAIKACDPQALKTKKFHHICTDR